MHTHQFQVGDLTVEHRRTDVRDVRLNIEPVPESESANRGHQMLITGEFTNDCPAGQNRFRLGQIVELRIRSLVGKYARMTCVITELIHVLPGAAGRRLYRWAFLVPLGADSDHTGLFPRTPGMLSQFTSGRAAMRVEELSLSELLSELGHDGMAIPIHFTAEGGYQPISSITQEMRNDL